MLMRQELIANMLGVRPEKAMAGALRLQNPRLIDYTRGLRWSRKNMPGYSPKG
jgi:hypothetical protein